MPSFANHDFACLMKTAERVGVSTLTPRVVYRTLIDRRSDTVMVVTAGMIGYL